MTIENTQPSPGQGVSWKMKMWEHDRSRSVWFRPPTSAQLTTWPQGTKSKWFDILQKIPHLNNFLTVATKWAEHSYWELPYRTIWSIRVFICKRPVRPDDHLQEAGPSRLSFARGRSIWMIICKRPANSNDHWQEAGLSGWSFARGQSIRMIICKRPVHPDDYLQEAGPSGWSFARGQPIQMIICKWPVHPDDLL